MHLRCAGSGDPCGALLIARALLRNAPFLVLDEPLNHLDAQGKEALLDELAKRSKGILMVSHQELAGDSLKWKLFDIQAQESLVMDNMICNETRRFPLFT